MKSHYRGHKMAIWLNLIPQLHQPGEQDVSMRHHHFHERANHYYAGTIRAESFTRIPPTQSTSVPSEPLQCPPNTTSDRPLGLSEFDHEDKHYNNYSAALGVTVGVGCLLLALNALIFSAIYYQRRKRWKRTSSSDEEPELKRQPPVPPVRTSSNPPQGQPSTVKKRVQIQEISV
ncbi:hypothetical protein AAG570_001725 [Ranatra chinensis]|uniref:Uncharacterized protein n=1 Tax=Ranatra chinensis TaxID=642074 RepID=A0ABD0Y9D3_9HEMI